MSDPFYRGEVVCAGCGKRYKLLAMSSKITWWVCYGRPDGVRRCMWLNSGEKADGVVGKVKDGVALGIPR